ncbi:putative wall-associated receptor kinase-like 16 [Vitis vinifera]|uniref:putative wall-associated receptor kinase-like 16 n=1 Tax=Vitis vinifera TaxID=29760 RepID=UPI00053FDAC8|nr:putative wall-associated receptor kinase-like 16 [Vitis vinifera]|eukprot:XP_010664061.1 PREDICTED: putative wall-associated receptor kinase-like 16 [Vitis vinifera]
MGVLRLVLWLATATAAATTESSSDEKCDWDKDFLLNCTATGLLLGANIPVVSVSVKEATLVVTIHPAYDCYNELGLADYFDQAIELVENSSFTFSDSRNKFTALGCDTMAYVMGPKAQLFVDPPVVLDWVIKGNCSRHDCGQKSICKDSNTTRSGYLCSCEQGYAGNPYLPNGCQDINECEDPKTYTCQGTCKNTAGNYTCSCPLGMHGNGKVACQGFRVTTFAAVIGAVVVAVVACILIFIEWKKLARHKNFKKNGGLLLKRQRIKLFTEAELKKATNNYDRSRLLGRGGSGHVYKGILADDVQVAVKKPVEADKIQINEQFQHEIDVVSQVNHVNVVKLLGLCLETPVTMLVYEFVSNGTLFQHIHDPNSEIVRSWKLRLRIAIETAGALKYLHSLADPPVIHRDVKSTNILLDNKHAAKVADFGTSVLIPLDQTAINTKIAGTLGYLDPEYMQTGNLTAKSDVYSFGVVVMELLTGWNPTPGGRSVDDPNRNIIHDFLCAVETNRLSDILNISINGEAERKQIEGVAELAKRCLSGSGVARPTMQQVEDELKGMQREAENLLAGESETGEETQSLLSEIEGRSSEKDESHSHTHYVTAFDIQPQEVSGVIIFP